MTENTRRMERLLLPKVRVEPAGQERAIPEAKHPLPRWQTIPLDAKFPVLPAPKGEVTFVTTKLGQMPYKSSQHKDFDLSDPYNHSMRSEYQPLFDPYLKGWFSKPSVQKQMLKNKLLTERGNVPVSVRDFNDYRFYLRKQALMSAGTYVLEGEENDAEDAKRQARRQAVIAKKKMRAEVFGIEVKYKSLKAAQASKQEEEEKRMRYIRKSESEDGRQQKKMEEEEKHYIAALKKSRSNWNKKKDDIKVRQEAIKKRAMQKLLQFERKAQSKLNKLDYLREQRFQKLDQQRKQFWRMRRLQQMKEMNESREQKLRVEAEMRTLKRKYEDKTARQMVKESVEMESRKEARFKQKERDQETYARRMAAVLKDTRYMTFTSSGQQATGSKRQNGLDSELTRSASIWMVQEVLNRLGLTEESRKLASQDYGTLSYLQDLDRALGVAVKKLEGVTVLGEEQEMLSRLAHVIWRRIKTAYPGKTPKRESKPARPKPDRSPRKRVKRGTNVDGKDEEEEEEEEGEEEDEEEGEEEQAQEVKEDEEQLMDKERAVKMIMEDTADEALTSGEDLALFFPDDDDGEEREQAVKISMLMSGDQGRGVPQMTMLGEARPRDTASQRWVEEEMDEFFKNTMRLTEVDALAMEAELMAFLNTIEDDKLKPEKMNKIIEMCLRLANHDVIETSEPCGELEANPYSHQYVVFDLDNKGSPAKEKISSRNSKPESAGDDFSFGESAQVTEEITTQAEGGETVGESEVTAAPAQEDGVPTEVEESIAPANDETDDINNDNIAGARTIDTTSNNYNRSSNVGGAYQDACRSREPACVTDHSASRSASAISNSFSNLSTSVESYTLENTANTLSRGHSVRSSSEINASANRRIVGGRKGTDVSQNKGDADGDDDGDNEAGDAGDEATMEGGLGQAEAATTDGETEADTETVTEAETEQQQAVEEVKTSPSTKRASIARSAIKDEFIPVANSESDSQADDPDASKEREEQQEFEVLAAADDVLGITVQMLMRIQEREKYRGVGIPQSRLLRYIAMTMSRQWRKTSEERPHEFGAWLEDPDTPGTIRSLIYNIKRRRFPVDLQKNLAKAAVSVCLQDVAYPAMPLTDALVKAVLGRFMSDLEKDEVRMSVMEEVLRRMLEEYELFYRRDLQFNVSLLLLDCLGHTHDLVTSGEITKRGHILPAIDNWGGLSLDARDTLECGHWPNMLHRASVAVRLDILSVGDKKALEKLVSEVCADYLFGNAPADLRQTLDMIRNKMALKKFKDPISLEISANSIVLLLETLNKSKITSTTLLPGAAQNVSQSACTSTNSASILGPYTSGEAVILLVMDKLACDMGKAALRPGLAEQMAASLADYMVTNHGHDPASYKGDRYPAALDRMLGELRVLSINFREVKRHLAAIFRPYLASTVRPFLEAEGEINLGAPSRSLPLTKAQHRDLLQLIALLFETFVVGITARSKQGGADVGNVSKKILAMYTWRALGKLAKQAKLVLKEIGSDHELRDVNSNVKASDSLIIERILRSVVDLGDNNNWVESSKCSNFLNAVMASSDTPGYTPVTDILAKREALLHARGKSRAQQEKIVEKLREPDDTPEEHAMRMEATPPELDSALRREIIAAARDIADAMVSERAMQQLAVKTADSFTATVYVIEKLLDNLYSKLWSVRTSLQRGRVSPNSIGAAVVGAEHCKDLPQLHIDKEGALKVVHSAINTLDDYYGAVLALSRLSESLSRAAHELLQSGRGTAATRQAEQQKELRFQPHPILASASPRLLAQWTRSCLLATLSTVSTVISGGQVASSGSLPGATERHWALPSTSERMGVGSGASAGGRLDSTSMHPKNTFKPEAVVLATSYVTVHNMIARVRNGVEREKTADGHWFAPRVAGTAETSQIGVPIEILDRVFARLAGIMSTLSCTNVENDGRIPETPTHLASTIINQVTSAITYHVEIGQFPMIRINDLINKANANSGPTKKALGGRTSSSVATPAPRPKRSESEARSEANNNNWSLNNSGLGSGLSDPVGMMEGRWSCYLFHSLMDVVGRMDEVLKHSVELSLQCRDTVTRDAKIRARASVSAMLEKVKQNAASNYVLLSNKLELSRKRQRQQQQKQQQQQQLMMITRGQAEPHSVISTDTTASPAFSRKISQAKYPDAFMSTTTANTGRVSSLVNTNFNKPQGGKNPPSAHSVANKPVLSDNVANVSSTSLTHYLRNLLRPLKETSELGDVFSTPSLNNSKGDLSNNKSADAISEILRAGYAVSYDLLRSFEDPACHGLKMQAFSRIPSSAQPALRSKPGQFEMDLDTTASITSPTGKALTVLVLDLLLEQLTTCLDEGQTKGPGAVLRTTAKSAKIKSSLPATTQAKASGSPYVASYRYTRPDPYGRFYAEVVDRGRRWCRLMDAEPLTDHTTSGSACGVASVPRIHSLTRELLAPGAPRRVESSGLDLTSTTSLQVTQSASSQPSTSLVAPDRDVSAQGRTPQGRDTSRGTRLLQRSVHSTPVDNRNNSWRRLRAFKGTFGCSARGVAHSMSTGAKCPKQTHAADSRQVTPKDTSVCMKNSSVSTTAGVAPTSSATVGGSSTEVRGGAQGSERNASFARKGKNTESQKYQAKGSSKEPLRTARTKPTSSHARDKNIRATTGVVQSKYRATAVTTPSRGLPVRQQLQLSSSAVKEDVSGWADTVTAASSEELVAGGFGSSGLCADQSKTVKHGEDTNDGQAQPRQSQRWREPKVEVIYHVTQESRQEAEEQLQRLRASCSEEAEQEAPLCQSDLHLFVLALLARDLPRETSVLQACLQGKGRLGVSALADVTDLLSVLDHALADLTLIAELSRLEAKQGAERRVGTADNEVGDLVETANGDRGVGVDEQTGGKDDANEEEARKAKVKVARLLKDAADKLEVSQRSAGAVHSLLRSVECGLIPELHLLRALKTCRKRGVRKVPELMVNALRGQLRTELGQVVERLEEGHGPRCITSSDWLRLADEIVRRAQSGWPRGECVLAANNEVASDDAQSLDDNEGYCSDSEDKDKDGLLRTRKGRASGRLRETADRVHSHSPGSKSASGSRSGSASGSRSGSRSRGGSASGAPSSRSSSCSSLASGRGESGNGRESDHGAPVVGRDRRKGSKRSPSRSRSGSGSRSLTPQSEGRRSVPPAPRSRSISSESRRSGDGSRSSSLHSSASSRSTVSDSSRASGARQTRKDRSVTETQSFSRLATAGGGRSRSSSLASQSEGTQRDADGN